MLSYNQIRDISKMFDPSINISLYEHNLDLEDDMDWNYNELNYPLSEFYATVDEQFDFSRNIIDDEPMSPQSQIRNHDCMWSGRCTTHPNECHLGSRNTCNTKYLNENDLKKTPQNQLNSTTSGTAHTQSKQLLQTASAIQTAQQTYSAQKKQQQQQQHNIPAGRSLLRLNQMKQPVIIKVPNVSTNDFLKDRDFIARPDTPLSLDDDPPEFKHNIDLAACTMGSNKMSLISESQTEIINILKEHLQDENSSQIQMRNKLSNYLPSITKNESIDDIYKDIKTFEDFQDEFDDEEDDAATESDSSFNATNNSLISSNNNISNNNTFSSSVSAAQSMANNSSMNTTQYENTQSMHSDHSYTRSKSRVDVISLGVQTPSDSEEEIDVVSVGDKNLPTNPSAKDRRALQTTVAHKITARIVKTSNGGIRTVTPRRRASDVSSDDSAYSSKVSNYSNYSETIATPSLESSPMRQNCHLADNAGSRKRANLTNSTNNSQLGTKRSKLSKKHSSSNLVSTNSSPSATPLSKRESTFENDEIETIEKRNLHNDMERQRRIGLKNLFENLKDKIPSLREKDRAPKVNILREATILCSKLARDDNEYESLKKRQQRLVQRLKQLRTSMATMRANNYA